MADLSILGSAGVSDAELVEIVAGHLDESPSAVELFDVTAEVVEYELPAITTAGRYWVRGAARTAHGDRPFAFFVKHVQSWARSPYFEFVPAEYREMAEASVPWWVEPTVYRSDLAGRLPKGLDMPGAVAVRDLDEKSCAIWLEEIDVVPRAWTVEDLAGVARLLGRLAASRPVRDVTVSTGIGGRRTIQTYVFGRLNMQVLPVLREDAVWQHPLVAAAFDAELRARMLAASDRVDDYVDELERVPLGTAHGDACTNNVLARRGSQDLVLIDYGFWGEAPVGFDLGQLLIGDVQLGRRPAADLPALEEACVPAYIEGLRAEGDETSAEVVRRAHALQMLIFIGLSALPIDMLEAPPTPAAFRTSAERAAAARFILDLVDASTPVAAPSPA